MNPILIKKNFYSEYQGLREEFENNFKDPRNANSKRFVWDFWYDKDRYHLIRTPAYYYFSQRKYQNFHSYLVQWGRENLGCHDISPPWLSYYVDGCYQKMHADVPHGPWAFVYSLTPNRVNYLGGETFILKPETLNFWSNFGSDSSYHQDHFMKIIPSRMNQLTVFDPRFPHGVTEVKGTRDPLESRVVVHGWFVNPRPYVVGGLKTNQVQKVLEQKLFDLEKHLNQIGAVNGTLSVRMYVNKNGHIQDYRVLTNTLVSTENQAADVAYLGKEIKSLFKFTQFSKVKKDSQITIPLVFK